MAYTPGTWVENVTVIHAADLARIEAGIAANADEPIGTAAQAAATSNTTAIAARAPLPVAATPGYVATVAPDGNTIAYAPPVVSRFGNRIAVTGDSITSQNATSMAIYQGQGSNWYTSLCLASAGALQYLWNGGHGGYTSTQLLALLQAEVLSTGPNLVGIFWGTNDNLDGSNHPTVTAANTKAAVTMIRAAGADVFLNTIPPQGIAALGTPPPPILTQQATGGTLGAGTYSYRVSATNSSGSTLASAAVTATFASGATNAVQIRVPHVDGANGFKVYGRTGGSELLIAAVASSGSALKPNLLYTDLGSITPAGALPVSDLTANAYNTVSQLKVTTINAWLRRYASLNRIPIVDNYALCVDPATGMYQTGWSIDGTHPTPSTSRKMGELAWATIKNLVASASLDFSLCSPDPLNLQPNPCFLTGTASLPTSWSSSGGSGTNFTDTRGPVAGFAGQALTCAVTAADVRLHASPRWSTGFAAGDRLAVMCLVSTSGVESGGLLGNIYLKADGTAATRVELLLSSDVTGVGAWYAEFVVQSGDTGYSLNHNVWGGTGSITIGQLTVRNLTVGNLLTP